MIPIDLERLREVAVETQSLIIARASTEIELLSKEDERLRAMEARVREYARAVPHTDVGSVLLNIVERHDKTVAEITAELAAHQATLRVETGSK